ncbi:MAG: hypothetical protein ACW98D_11800 [Promethearchaeota archaeon]
MLGKINLGVEVHDYYNGGVTENVPIKRLKGNLLISGGARNERTALLSHVLNQFYREFPDIGVLLIQLGSSEDTYLYNIDKVYEYGDPELIIPYFTGEEFTEQNRDQFTRYINAIFGFHFEMRIVISILTRHYKGGRIASSIVDFLENLKNCLLKNPYSEEFNESNISSFQKAIEIFEEDPILERTISIPLKNPEWLNHWSKGGKICIDLSKCDLDYQQLLVTLILQAIKNFTNMNESSNPTGIVVLEDADIVLQKPPHEEYIRNYELNREHYKKIEDENYFLTKEQIEEALGDNNYLRNVQLEDVYYHLIWNGYRYRNIALITVCEDPTKIYDFIRRYSQIKIDME